MLTREELKLAHNNVMTVMENHIMSITFNEVDRKTANMIANEVLDLDREAEEMLTTYDDKLAKIKRDIINNLDELSCTDLQEIRYIAKQIVDKRLEECKKIDNN